MSIIVNKIKLDQLADKCLHAQRTELNLALKKEKSVHKIRLFVRLLVAFLPTAFFIGQFISYFLYEKELLTIEPKDTQSYINCHPPIGPPSIFQDPDVDQFGRPCTSGKVELVFDSIWSTVAFALVILICGLVISEVILESIIKEYSKYKVIKLKNFEATESLFEHIKKSAQYILYLRPFSFDDSEIKSVNYYTPNVQTGIPLPDDAYNVNAQIYTQTIVNKIIHHIPPNIKIFALENMQSDTLHDSLTMVVTPNNLWFDIFSVASKNAKKIIVNIHNEIKPGSGLDKELQYLAKNEQRNYSIYCFCNSTINCESLYTRYSIKSKICKQHTYKIIKQKDKINLVFL